MISTGANQIVLGEWWPSVFPGIAISITVFGFAVLALFAFTFYESYPLSFLGGVFPTAVAVVGVLMTVVALLPLMRGNVASTANFDMEIAPRDGDIRFGPWNIVAWLAAFVAGVALIGFFMALVGFFIVFLRVMAQTSWLKTLILTAAAAAFILTLANNLNLLFPGGILQAYYDLPWPIR
jgi:hypothetical protein